MFFKEVGLTEENIKILIDFSREWEKKNSTYGYRANTKEDLTGNRIFFACDHEQVIGYLFGNFFDSKRMQSIMPDHTKCFEVEELYVSPGYRSMGIGKGLYLFVERILKGEAEYMILNTATKNWKSIFHFYLDEVGMDFWSARLYKKLI